jgi:RES domain-containing protein
VIRAWRICKDRWAETAFSGTGAAEFPGRWNSVGSKMVYASSSQALAALELLAHVEDRSYLRRARFSMIGVEIPEELVLTPKRFPAGWQRIPPGDSSRSFGDRFLRLQTFAVMRVPSAVVPEEYNFLINPLHKDFRLLRIGRPERFQFDARLA